MRDQDCKSSERCGREPIGGRFGLRFCQIHLDELARVRDLFKTSTYNGRARSDTEAEILLADR